MQSGNIFIKKIALKCENLFKKNTILLNQQQIDAEQIRALQRQNEELTDELKALRESVKNYGAGCYENGLRNGKRKLEQQIEKMKCALNKIIKTVQNNFKHIPNLWKYGMLYMPRR